MPASSTPKPMTRFSTVAEVAAALRVSKMSIYRLVEDEELPAFRVGRSIRIPTQAVWDYLDGRRIAPNADARRISTRGDNLTEAAG